MQMKLMDLDSTEKSVPVFFPYSFLFLWKRLTLRTLSLYYYGFKVLQLTTVLKTFCYNKANTVGFFSMGLAKSR